MCRSNRHFNVAGTPGELGTLAAFLGHGGPDANSSGRTGINSRAAGRR